MPLNELFLCLQICQLIPFSTAWHSQPYSRGSYSSIGIGGQQAHIEKIAEPLYQKPMKRTVSP